MTDMLNTGANIISPAFILEIFDIAEFLVLITVTFVIITVFLVPSIAMMAFIHFRTNHVKLLVETRKTLIAIGIPAVTIQPNILSEDLEDIVEVIDTAKKKD